MNEDACQIYCGNEAELLAGVRHMPLNMLRVETSKKLNIRRKQKKASMNIAYLEQILLFGINTLGKN